MDFKKYPGVKLVAVSKQQSIEKIRAAYVQGQRAFAENYWQEACDKIQNLSDLNIEWHFIGSVQSNKTNVIAQHFSWVQTLDRLVIAKRLSQQRPGHLPALNVLIQVNIDDENSKSGVHPDEVQALAMEIQSLPHLHVRGLMAIPNPNAADISAAFSRMHVLFATMIKAGFQWDTLSMGMSHDYELAIAAGATMVRIGTAFFGKR